MAFDEDPRIVLEKDRNKVRDVEISAQNIKNELYLIALKIERIKLDETPDGN